MDALGIRLENVEMYVTAIGCWFGGFAWSGRHILNAFRNITAILSSLEV